MRVKELIKKGNKLEVKTDLFGIVCAGRKGYNNEDWGGKNCWTGGGGDYC
jgi:hypothetical protein